ncbi:MAG: glycosyltransferase [Proteobacteria bacterium]|jgi:glycosyltransferase involved in cell wall biosynthesis|nr:glycosyltransferase family 4 protein [Alphaproteobacteria bacterium]NCC02492.1 glycosyltransferase [Pseudomonadota bacterium]
MTYAIDYLHTDAANRHGINVAIQEFMKAWLRHSSQNTALAHVTDQASHDGFLALAKKFGKKPQDAYQTIHPYHQRENLAKLGCLFLPDPDINKSAWWRAQIKGSHTLCGLVHSLSGDQVARVLSDMLLAPLGANDALICPSLAIRDAVHQHWSLYSEYLSARFKTDFTPKVQTPVIPLGIDSAAFQERVTPDKRAAQRQTLGIEDDEVVILFVGRLNFATKAHPLPLLLAVEKAAKQTDKKVRLVLYGYFSPREEMSERFHALAKDFVTSFRCDIIENTDKRFPDGLWACGDIFTSLVDNIQESFGLTPIEAQACGLPVVVTDWDGYRDGVIQGETGFLVETYAPPGQAGQDLAGRYLFDQNYGSYLATTSQSTPVDIDSAAKAFATLILDSNMRQKMSQRAKAHASTTYDWSVIIRQYEALWAELAAHKATNLYPAIPENWQAVTPCYPNPLTVFRSFPSREIMASDSLSLAIPPEQLSTVMRHDMNCFATDLLLPLSLCLSLIETIGTNAPLPVSALLAIAPNEEKSRMWRTIGWLLKHGICRLHRGD